MDVTTKIYVGILVLSSILSSVAAGRLTGHGLHAGFYRRSCPQAERIVLEVVSQAVVENPGLAAGLIRLHFHDCFVNGCDASILLDSTPSGEPIEKVSPGNIGLRGCDLIDEAKSRLEEECPKTVSCADILAYAARDAISLSGFPAFLVPGGRRDGLSSRADDVAGNLPVPIPDLDQMLQIFEKKGMTQDDLVVLLGSHSIGVVHCTVISNNLYNFNLTHQVDPSLDPIYALYLRTRCPPPGSDSLPGTVVPIDPTPSGNRLNNMFYLNLMQARAVIPSDQVLFSDQRTRNQVIEMALDYRRWSKKFLKAMVKMGRIDVLTGRKGEIRRACRAVN
ncbi:hypothetical protein Nepgr_007492 [Nepenthes gracilis]|uniref:Peroxidase n=1 Tax=Nepenthes gracilis TaxID=150966 RepID=A0AAD3XIB4_NEPGR|nr:hypothetical protein Nepgr_007492 [Nepenthes gracilis]